MRTSAEIFQELLSAFWRGELALVGGNERQIIYPETFLKYIALKRDHPGFTLVDSPEMIPPKLTERLDGGVMIDLQTYIVLPSDHALWTSEIISAACDQLANLSLEHYHDLIQPAVFALRCTKQSLAGYCEGMGYDRPRFWFGETTRTRTRVKSFGGRPSVMRPIETEMRRRARAQLLAATLREEAKELRCWAEDKIDPQQQIPQVGAIENALRELYWELRRTSDSVHKT